MTRPTHKALLTAVRALGLAITYDTDTAEYRVTLRRDVQPDAEAREAIAAYCDREDALGTAEALARWAEGVRS